MTLISDSSIQYVVDHRFAFGQGPVGYFQNRLLADKESVLLGEQCTQVTIQCTEANLIAYPDTTYWHAELIYEDAYAIWYSAFVHEKIFRAAWCLLCSDHELPFAIRTLITTDPDRVVRWLDAGQISADDGSLARPFPPLRHDDLLPLLQHPQHEIRTQAIASLSKFDGKPVRFKRNS